MKANFEIRHVNTLQTADQINNAYTADYLDMRQVTSLSEGKKSELLESLLADLAAHCRKLTDNPQAISSDQIKELAAALQLNAATINASGSKTEDKKGQFASLLKKTKEILGPSADIIVSITKVLQLFGSLG